MAVFRAHEVTKIFGTGLLEPTSGTITLGTDDLVAHPDLARHRCSYLPQAQLPIDPFKVREVIELTGRIRGGPPARVRDRASAPIDAPCPSPARPRPPPGSW
jgi:ABC-2 type transport system ATP-binding protein